MCVTPQQKVHFEPPPPQEVALVIDFLLRSATFFLVQYGMVQVAKFGSIFMERNVVDWVFDGIFSKKFSWVIGLLLLACYTTWKIVFFQKVSLLLAFHLHACHTTSQGAF